MRLQREEEERAANVSLVLDWSVGSLVPPASLGERPLVLILLLRFFSHTSDAAETLTVPA